MTEKINILLVDDNPADIFLIKDLLLDSDLLIPTFFETDSVQGALNILKKERIDLILLDMFLPDSSGVETFNSVYEKHPETSIIILSGLSDKNIAFKTVQAGAQDFLLKGEFDERLLEKSIIYSIERKKNIQLIEDSEKKYRALFEVTPLPLFIVSLKDYKIININDEAKCVFGYSESEFHLKKLNELFYNNHNLEEVTNKAKTKDQQFRTITKRKNGSEILVDVTLKNVVLADESFLLVQMEDVTERVNFEKNKLDIINSIQDSERSNFAMELHDGLAQELVLLNIYIDQINEKCNSVPEIQQSKKIVNDALKQTRRLTYNVSPPLLNKGFFKGLIVLFERFNDVNDMSISLHLDRKLEMSENYLADEVSYNSFRIIQEFLNNSIKHADANEIKGQIDEYADYYEIKISDNGKGFNENTSKSAGMGITNMHKRANLFQIKIKITSEEKTGTTLLLKIPKSDADQKM
ncbi:MAG: response regulator [Brumimicrobium sp.]